MLELKGKYNIAKVYTDNVDSKTIGQIMDICNLAIFEGSSIRIMPDCLTEDTEVLTPEGFKLITDLDVSDLIANYNNGAIFFSKPKSIVIRDLKEGEIVYEYSSKNPSFSLKVSDKHRMALKDSMGILARDVPFLNLSNMVLSGDYNGAYSRYNNYDINYLLLLLWVVGDGSYSFTGKDTVRVRFDFRKDRKIKRVIELLDGLNIVYYIHKNGAISLNTTTSKEIYTILGKSKKYPFDLIYIQRDKRVKLIEELIKIDGDYTNYINFNTYRLNSKRREDIDFFQALMCLTDRYTTFKTRISTGFGRKTLMYYTFSKYESDIVKSKSGFGNRVIDRKEIDYKGKLVCVECDSSYFIIRQNGSVSVTGNCHVGKGCTIGTTLTIQDKIIPGLVGVDLGCGMTSIEVDNLDLDKLDAIIRKYVPHGFNTHKTSREKDLLSYGLDLTKLKAPISNINRAYLSVGTLGGGNHFIEVGKTERGTFILTVHSGSRNIGKQVAEYYQGKAIEHCIDKYNKVKDNIIAELKANNQMELIEGKLKEMSKRPTDDLCYLDGSLMQDYLNDMDIAQKYANINRQMIIVDILRHYNDEDRELEKYKNYVKDNAIECIHNYIDLENSILRKGAISAQEGERVIIPINMRDGIIFGRGKGNADWNYSAPHGAGRILSRGEAKKSISLEDYKETMSGIYTTCVNLNTIDEAPQAYKPIEDILNNIGATVEIEEIVKPIYNFKSN